MRIFGFEFRRVIPDEQFPSFVPPEPTGEVTVAATAFAGSFVDLEGTVRTEAELITRYRNMSLQPEIVRAIDEITNEAVTRDDDGEVVKLFLDDIEISANLKKLIEAEFDNVKSLLKFNTRYFDIFRRWYIDGRLYYHAIINPDKPDEGLQEVRYIDPRKIRKVREITRKRGMHTPGEFLQTKTEYYIYNDRGFAPGMKSVGTTSSGLRIAKDSIVQVTSGLIDTNGTMVLSYLHQAIKPLNELRAMEDATVIYRLARAPERRVWYIDVGQLPKMKAEQYVRDIMTKHKNRLTYDAQTGEIKDERRFMTMLEDYWLPRREGGRGTQVETLPGGQNLGKMDDVDYFQKKLYNSLQVPVSRLEPTDMFSLGRPMEITREELKFGKFVDRLRQRFATLFTELLEKQCVLKKIFSIEEFQVFKDMIDYEFSEDSRFEELKDSEILTARMQVLQLMQPFVGMYYSNEYVRKEILKQDDNQIKEIDEQIAEEQQNYQYLPPDQKSMLQQQDMQAQAVQQGERQAQQQAATPQGQAQQVVDQAQQQPPDSLQGMSTLKRSQKLIASSGQ